jgi:dTDP-4-dehydrorhamnose 3,5-epimerase
MKFIETPLSGAYVIELEPFRDERGLFARTFCQEEFAKIGFDKQIVQINYSITRKKGAIRGMHYQRPPASEIKIIRCLQGKVFDVMVDLRAGSPTFMQWHSVELSKDNMRMVYIPEGFAHGFQALTDNAELIYHHSALYRPEYERGLRFDDPALAIAWPLPTGIISIKDQSYSLIDNNFKGIET